jgi:hypothetical protein
MKRIILPDSTLTKTSIDFKDINDTSPIFVEHEGRLIGMVLKEKDGWIIRIGRSLGATGHHESLRGCLLSGVKHGYIYFIE